MQNNNRQLTKEEYAILLDFVYGRTDVTYYTPERLLEIGKKLEHKRRSVNRSIQYLDQNKIPPVFKNHIKQYYVCESPTKTTTVGRTYQAIFNDSMWGLSDTIFIKCDDGIHRWMLKSRFKYN